MSVSRPLLYRNYAIRYACEECGSKASRESWRAYKEDVAEHADWHAEATPEQLSRHADDLKPPEYVTAALLEEIRPPTVFSSFLGPK